MGHSQVAVLDGGWPAWCSAGLPIDTTPVDMEGIEAPAKAAQGGGADARFHAALEVPVICPIPLHRNVISVL